MNNKVGCVHMDKTFIYVSFHLYNMSYTSGVMRILVSVTILDLRKRSRHSFVGATLIQEEHVVSYCRKIGHLVRDLPSGRLLVK